MEHRGVFILETIIEYCDRIAAAIDKYSISKERFLNDQNLQDMLAFCIIQIGESAHDLSGEFVKNHPGIEWRKIIGFRNTIVHNYGSFVPEILWDAIEKNIPELKEYCSQTITK